MSHAWVKRSTLLALTCICLAFVAPHAFSASRENAQSVSDRFGFDGADVYMKNVDGMIAELRKYPGTFSGSENKDTEELRVRLTRERLAGMQDEVMDTARGFIAENLSDDDVEHLISNMAEDGQIKDAQANETKDQVVKFYRDAIFNAIIASAVPVQEQADQIKN